MMLNTTFISELVPPRLGYTTYQRPQYSYEQVKFN